MRVCFEPRIAVIGRCLLGYSQVSALCFQQAWHVPSFLGGGGKAGILLGRLTSASWCGLVVFLLGKVGEGELVLCILACD